MVAIALSGGIAGNIVFSWLVQSLGWRHSFLITALLGLAILYIMHLFLFEPANLIKKYSMNLATMYKDLKSVLLTKQNILTGFIVGLMNLPVFTLATLWGNYYLGHLYHISTMNASLLSSSIFMGVILGSITWGFISGRYIRPVSAVWLGCILMLLLFTVLFTSHSLSYLQLMVYLFGLGFFSSAQIVNYNFISQSNTRTVVSTAMGVSSLISNSIGASGQMLYGWLSQSGYLNHLSLIKVFGRLNTVGLILFLPSMILCLALLYLLNHSIKIENKKGLSFSL